MKKPAVLTASRWPLCMHSSCVTPCFADWEKSLKNRWNAKSVYVVGSATASLGKEFGKMKVQILGGMDEISYSDHPQPGTYELLIFGILHLVFPGHS